MNFEEFRDTYFNGDEDRALAHCAYESYNQDFCLTGSKEVLEGIVKPLTGERSKKFYKFFKIEIKLNPGIMVKEYAPVLDIIGGSDSSWKYDEEFIKKGNPFGKKIKRNLINSLIGIAVISFIIIVINVAGLSSYLGKIVPYLYLLVGGYMAFPLCRNIDDYFEFKKAEKRINDSKNETKTLDEHLDEVIARASKKIR